MKLTRMGTSAVAVAASMLLLMGCSSPSQKVATQSNEPQGQQAATVDNVDDIKAAFFSAASSNTYLQAGIDAAEEYAKEVGFSLDVFDGEFDAQKQIDQLEQAITSGKYNAFAIEALDGNLVCNTVRDAVAAGIMVTAVGTGFCDRSALPVEELYEPGTVAVVNGQSLSIYQDWVRQVMNDYPDGAKIAIISGPSLSGYTVNLSDAAELFGDGYEVLANQATDYTTAQAFAAAQTIVQSNPTLDVIMSNFSGMSRGVLQATAGTDIAVYDFGGDQWSLEQVKAGTLKSTIMMLPRQETEYALSAIVELVRGNTPPTIIDLTKDASLPDQSPFVYRENVDKFVAQY